MVGAGGCQVKAQIEAERFLLQGSLHDLRDLQMNIRHTFPYLYLTPLTGPKCLWFAPGADQLSFWYKACSVQSRVVGLSSGRSWQRRNRVRQRCRFIANPSPLQV